MYSIEVGRPRRSGSIPVAFSGSENQVVNFKSSFRNNTINDIVGTVNDFKEVNPEGKIILVGHSLGAENTINAAQALDNTIIDLVVTLDIVNFIVDNNASSNIINLVNIYQRNDLPNGAVVRNNETGNTFIQNFEALNSSHTTIDNDFAGTLVQMISNITGVALKNIPKVNSKDEVEKR